MSASVDRIWEPAAWEWPLMIKANLRLVVKIAREYQNYGVPLLDLVLI
jgi:hypothetical protein